MNSHSRPGTAIEKEISRLEAKLKQMGAIMGHRPDIPPEMHLAFLRRVYAFEMNERQSRRQGKQKDPSLN
jgi:hypothetical protein